MKKLQSLINILYLVQVSAYNVVGWEVYPPDPGPPNPYSPPEGRRPPALKCAPLGL